MIDQKLLTDYGKYLVHLHEKDFNAQAIFTALAINATDSTQATLDTATLLTYITSVKLKQNGMAPPMLLFSIGVKGSAYMKA